MKSDGTTTVAGHLKATGEIVKGMRVTCTSEWGIQRVYGKVLTATNYGTAEKPDWYIELQSPRDGFCCVKQRIDQATIVVDTDVTCFHAVLSNRTFARIVPGGALIHLNDMRVYFIGSRSECEQYLKGHSEELLKEVSYLDLDLDA